MQIDGISAVLLVRSIARSQPVSRRGPEKSVARKVLRDARISGDGPDTDDEGAEEDEGEAGSIVDTLA